jgi:NAD(P)-dependent dehydrogenase (short-subunit alcohol dehydrogenase family)
MDDDWSIGAGLEGRGVVVTGAAGGIGSAIIRAFCKTGARVMGVDVDRDRVSAVFDGCSGGGHVAVAADLADLSTHGVIVERARSELGELYVLVHAAAVLVRRSNLDAVTEEDWDIQIDTNLKASFFLCRAAARAMVEQGRGGRIVTFSSQGWWTGGFGGSVVYAASKGGIVSMSRGLARTYGPAGITVNSIAPGQVKTPMLLRDLDPAVYERMRQETPLGYVAEPEEIAGVAVFLASDHARYISGATINVSGGFLMY